MELVVRELAMGDIPKVANVYIKAYAEEDWNEQWACKDAAQRIYEIISSPHCKGGICVLNEEVIGCILFEILTWHTGKQLEIKEIFVIPSFQRQGIGKKLLEYAEIIGKEVGVRELFLWTNKSEKLINFYSKLGYRDGCNTTQFIKKWRY